MKQLGKRPPKRAPALPFHRYVMAPAVDATGAVVPPYPATFPPPVNEVFPMDHNDSWGDCVVAGMDHLLEVITKACGVAYTNMTDAQLVADYQTQNPDFDPNGDPNVNGPGSQADGGMDMQTYLEYLTKQKRILGFAAVNHTDPAEIASATYLGYVCYTGEQLQVAQQNQSIWDFVEGSPVWGGHCTDRVGFNPNDNITWGTLIQSTPAWDQHCLEEAWFVIPQVLWDHPAFRGAANQAQFAADYTAITGQPFPAPVPVPPPTPPVPVPPPPAPTPPAPPAPPDPPPAPPTPPPTPPTPPDPTTVQYNVSADNSAMIERRAAKHGVDGDTWLNHRLDMIRKDSVVEEILEDVEGEQ